jgi:hypothetical protein
MPLTVRDFSHSFVLGRIRPVKYIASFTALFVLFGAAATAASEKDYVWTGWRMTDADYAIAHSLPKDPTDNDFYLVCHGGRDQVDLAIRSLTSGGYRLESETGLPTTFVFGKKRIAAKAVLRGPSEMLGGIVVEYTFERDDPVLAAIAHGKAFRVVLPKVTTQLFAPRMARAFFAEMASRCKRGS